MFMSLFESEREKCANKFSPGEQNFLITCDFFLSSLSFDSNFSIKGVALYYLYYFSI